MALEKDGWKLCREQTVVLDDSPLSDEQSSNPFDMIWLSIRACSCIRTRSVHSVSMRKLRTLTHLQIPQSTKPEFQELPLRFFDESCGHIMLKHDQLLIVLDFQSSPDTVPLSLLLAVGYQPSGGVSVMMFPYVNSDGGYGAFEQASTVARVHSHDISVFRPGDPPKLELVAGVTPFPIKRPNAQAPYSAHGSRIDIFDQTTNGSCSKETTI